MVEGTSSCEHRTCRLQPKDASAASPMILANKNVEAVVYAVRKAKDIVINMLAKGFTLSKDALNKAKAFDEQHNPTSTASAKVTYFDQNIGLSEKSVLEQR